TVTGVQTCALPILFPEQPRSRNCGPCFSGQVIEDEAGSLMLANPNAPSSESEAVRGIQSHVCPHLDGSELLGVELVESAGLSGRSEERRVGEEGGGERYLG